MYTQTTNQIKVTVKPAIIEENSAPDRNLFAFSYTILIENLSDSTVQLLERYWLIKSAEVQIAEVTGPGVVGVQPVLGNGEAFEYTSGAVIHDPVGSMQGKYTFRSADGKFFEVEIPKFDLVYDRVLN